MNKTARVVLPVTPAEKELYQALADQLTEGNIAYLVRLAMREFSERHPLGEQVYTEYEVETQSS